MKQPSKPKPVLLDTAKFRSELRIALINGDKIWLTYDKTNEVSGINEKDKPQV